MIPSFHLVSEALMSALAARSDDWTSWTLIEVSTSPLSNQNLKDLPTDLPLKGTSIALRITTTQTPSPQPLWIVLPGDCDSPSLAVSKILSGSGQVEPANFWTGLSPTHSKAIAKIKNSKGFFSSPPIEFGADLVALIKEL